MSFPFRAGLRPSTFNSLVEVFRYSVERVPDQRTGANVVYSLADAALGHSRSSSPKARLSWISSAPWR